MKCNNCGSELKPGAGFCENCGMIISIDGVADEPVKDSSSSGVDNSDEFDAILGDDIVQTSISDDVSTDEASVEDLPVSGEEAQSVDTEDVNEKPDEIAEEDAPLIIEPVVADESTQFEDIQSFDEGMENIDMEEAVVSPEADSAETVDEQLENNKTDSASTDYDDYDDEYDDDYNAMLIPVKKKGSKKGPLVAAIIVVLLVAVGAGALTLKNGDFKFNLPEIFKKPTAPNSLSTTTTESTTFTTKKNTTESTTEEDLEKEESTDETEKKSEKTTGETETVRVDNAGTTSSSGKSESTSSVASQSVSSQTQGTTASQTQNQPTATTVQSTTAFTSQGSDQTTQATTIQTTTQIPVVRPDAIKKLDLPGIPTNIKLPDEFLNKPYTRYSNGKKGINLYSSPKESAKLCGWARTGRELLVLAENGDWLFVHSAYYGTYGWIKSGSVSENKPVASEKIKVPGLVSPEKEFSEVTTKVVNAKGSILNLRKGPSKDYKRILSLVNGTELKILGTMENSSKWVYVLEPMTGYYGWVYAEYLK